MNSRFICPHCHSPIDPLNLEVATSARATYRICTECDAPMVFSMIPDGSEETLPVILSGRGNQGRADLAARSQGIRK